MKHTDQYGLVYYDPKPETIRAQAKLDKILQHTRFNHRTKALWAYFRGSKRAVKSRNKIRDLVILNLLLNGALERRLTPARCFGCSHTMDCLGNTRQRMNRVKRSIRPTTIADWTHAVTLIDIALEK